MPDSTYVKVCGLDTTANVSAAVEAGADAIGFVWWDRSPRHSALEEIRALASEVDALTVLVTVDLTSAELVEAAGSAGVRAVQPHGEHAAVAAAAARRLGLEVIRPKRVNEDLSDVAPGDLLLLDTPDPDLPGGTGRSFDWPALAGIERRFLLAGGLTPDTVAEAVRQVRPFGVDASSGLESAPGIKHPDLIRRFIHEAKSE